MSAKCPEPIKPNALSYLGVTVQKPRVAFFELTSCEGCQLQLLNNEASLLEFLALVEVVNFREAMTDKSEVYDIAFVEGCVTRADEITRLEKIRGQARILIAFGSCACFGGVNQLKNRFASQAEVVREVYGPGAKIETSKAAPLAEFVKIDLEIYGCPIKKEEVEKIVSNLVIGKAIEHPKYPVCMECKANENLCLFDLGELCLGPVTRAGCDAWCPASRMGCWGCRGPAEDANLEQLTKIIQQHGFSKEQILDRLDCFGGFNKFAARYRQGVD